jgi:hypothetical protein
MSKDLRLVEVGRHYARQQLFWRPHHLGKAVSTRIVRAGPVYQGQSETTLASHQKLPTFSAVRPGTDSRKGSRGRSCAQREGCTGQLFHAIALLLIFAGPGELEETLTNIEKVDTPHISILRTQQQQRHMQSHPKYSGQGDLLLVL